MVASQYVCIALMLYTRTCIYIAIVSFNNEDDIELFDRILAGADYTEMDDASFQAGFN